MFILDVVWSALWFTAFVVGILYIAAVVANYVASLFGKKKDTPDDKP